MYTCIVETAGRATSEKWPHLNFERKQNIMKDVMETSNQDQPL